MTLGDIRTRPERRENKVTSELSLIGHCVIATCRTLAR